MGKYVLTIGLMRGTEHTCNTCALRDGLQCRVPRWDVETQTKFFKNLELKNRETIRPECCPLVQVESWPNEKPLTDMEFSLA